MDSGMQWCPEDGVPCTTPLHLQFSYLGAQGQCRCDKEDDASNTACYGAQIFVLLMVVGLCMVVKCTGSRQLQ